MKSAGQANGRKKKVAVAEKIINHGICSSCENLPLCSFIHGSRIPVEFCEEFASPKTEKTATRLEVVTKGTSPLERSKGLCATCENAAKCLYPKDEAGIWHCEEYR